MPKSEPITGSSASRSTPVKYRWANRRLPVSERSSHVLPPALNGWAVALMLFMALCSSSCQAPPAETESSETTPSFPEVRIEDGWFTVGGEKFLVVGMGYEIGARPGRVPWDRDFQPDLLRADFERIVAAGFNTIRTWAPMTDEEIAIAAEYGLWVIMGLWIDAAGNYADPAFREESYAFYERELTRLSRHPNILCYLLLNEPHADTVYHAGGEKVNEFYRELVRMAKRCDPARSVSYSNCVATDWMVPDMFDFVAQNVYPYSPSTIEKALGYREYLEIIRERLGAKKPMLITEFGLSVSPAGDGRGYGGNTLEEQRDGDVQLWNDIINAGCAGGCAFMWVDGWWKNGDENTHNDHAEEWYGFLGADEDYVGIPRPVYYALRDYNRFIRTRPRDGEVVGERIQVEVWGPEVHAVEAHITAGVSAHLERHGNWWVGELDGSGLADGYYAFEITAHDAEGESLQPKSCTVRLVRHTPSPSRPRVQLLSPSGTVHANQGIPVYVLVTNGDGVPMANRDVRIDLFVHTGWYEHGVDLQTDQQGKIHANFPALAQPGMISLAAGMEYTDGPAIRRTGDYVHLEVLP